MASSSFSFRVQQFFQQTHCRFLWSTSSSCTLHCPIHALFHPVHFDLAWNMPIHCSIFHCNTVVISSVSLDSLHVNLSVTLIPNHRHLGPLKCHLSIKFYCHVTFNFAQNLCITNIPVIRRETSLLVSRGTGFLNLLHPFHTVASTAGSASPSVISMSQK